MPQAAVKPMHAITSRRLDHRTRSNRNGITRRLYNQQCYYRHSPCNTQSDRACVLLTEAIVVACHVGGAP